MQKAIALVLLLTWGLASAESIPLIREHGTFVVPVLINNKITLNFTLDSGASDVSIPADVFSTLTRAGTVSKGDFLDTQEYELANGAKETSQRFRIQTLRIGSFELRNVIASVAPSAGSLLLGQSFLSRLKSWSIDNDRQLLVFDESESIEGAPKAVQPEVRTDNGTVDAPSSSPIATDLHAAYCLEVIQYTIRLAEDTLSATIGISQENKNSFPDVPDTESSRTYKATIDASIAEARADLDSQKGRLRRLKLYLLPRIPDDNIMGIVGAQSAAKNDVARIKATVSACTACARQHSGMQCVNDCVTRAMPDYPSIQEKTKSCQSLEWLPF